MSGFQVSQIGSKGTRFLRTSVALPIFLAVILSGCAAPQPAAPNGASAAPTTASASDATPAASEAGSDVDLSGVKSYLLEKTSALKAASNEVKAHADAYYELAKAANFDYNALWSSEVATVTQSISDTRAAWMAASPLYEQMEGIVGGTPSLSSYDVILDAGPSAAQDPENAVPFDLNLPDGRVLPKPGNLFGVTESTLWGTFPEFQVADFKADWNGDGTIEFGENLPDPNVLKAGADALASYAAELDSAAQAWEPTASDAFTSLVVMVPTMTELFESWRDSRFVSGDKSTQRDFVVVSRLSDISDILGSIEVIYSGVQPLVQTVDADQATQIGTDLTALRTFVQGIYTQEEGGKHYTPEDADLLGTEAQDRATAITGRVSQVAAQLGVKIEE